MTDEAGPGESTQVGFESALSSTEMAAALTNPALLEGALAWAGLTVTRLDSQRLRVATTDVRAEVRASVDGLRYLIHWEESDQTPVAARVQLQPGEQEHAWCAHIDPIPNGAGSSASLWLPRVMRALPAELTRLEQQSTRPAEPASGSRWIWVLAFVVLLLALGLAV